MIRHWMGKPGLLAACTLVALALGSTQVFAQVILNDDFTAAEGYSDGLIQFQNSPQGGGWLGQGGTMIDTSGDGVVISSAPGFLRNVFNAGATGGLAGLASENNEVGGGFSLGDSFSISVESEFTLPSADNFLLSQYGVADCFASCGFDARPRAGIENGFSNFGEGALRVFSHFGRDSFRGSDTAFGLNINARDIGINNGKNTDNEPSGEPLDLVSDQFRIDYSAELTDEATNTWTATQLTVTNLDTGMLLLDAAVDNPAALESFVFDSIANAPDTDPTTPTEQGVAFHPTDPGSELYFAALWAQTNDPSLVVTTDSVFFEFNAVPGAPVAGDYNGNGVVDAADYTVWRDSLGQIGPDLVADGTGDDDLGVPDGDVDEFDYQFWANRFGNTSGLAAATAAPEPSSALLVGLLLVGVGRRRR